MTDHELIQKTRAGDAKAFEQLVKRYESQVAATVTGMLGKSDDADDVGQEVFIRFYKAIDRFREESGLGTYLTRIAINLSLNALKRRQRRWSLFKHTDDEVKAAMADPTDSFATIEKKEMVHMAIQKLEPEFRAVVVLRLIDGYSTAETAELLGVPQGTVLSRLARAQKKLRAILTPLIEETP